MVDNGRVSLAHFDCIHFEVFEREKIKIIKIGLKLTHSNIKAMIDTVNKT